MYIASFNPFSKHHFIGENWAEEKARAAVRPAELENWT